MSINTTTGRQYDYFKNLIVPNSCYFKKGYNPVTKQKVMTKRNIIQVEE